MEAVLILVAIAVGAFALLRGFGSEPAAPPGLESALAPRAELPFAGPALPTLAATVGRALPVHIFTGPPARVHQQALPPPGGDQYTLALTRQPGGQWASVLHGPPVTTEGGALTVTLVVPWGELSERFSAVNLVVR